MPATTRIGRQPYRGSTLPGVEAPPGFTCVDCGGRTRLLSYRPEDGWEPGDVVAYRCPDCGERFDVVLEAGDDDHPEPGT